MFFSIHSFVHCVFLCYFRTQLAALHYNENSKRIQASTKEGEVRWHILYPRYKQGDYTVRPLKTNPTYSQLLYFHDDKTSNPSYRYCTYHIIFVLLQNTSTSCRTWSSITCWISLRPTRTTCGRSQFLLPSAPNTTDQTSKKL